MESKPRKFFSGALDLPIPLHHWSLDHQCFTFLVFLLYVGQYLYRRKCYWCRTTILRYINYESFIFSYIPLVRIFLSPAVRAANVVSRFLAHHFQKQPAVLLLQHRCAPTHLVLMLVHSWLPAALYAPIRTSITHSCRTGRCRIRGSVPLTNGSGSFLQWLYFSLGLCNCDWRICISRIFSPVKIWQTFESYSLIDFLLYNLRIPTNKRIFYYVSYNNKLANFFYILPPGTLSSVQKLNFWLKFYFASIFLSAQGKNYFTPFFRKRE